MIRVKEGVKFSILRNEMHPILKAVDQVYTAHGYECWLTCGTEGHNQDDPHTNGFAYDFRVWNIPEVLERLDMLSEIEKIVGRLFYCVYESEVRNDQGKVLKGAHFHFQIRKDLWRNLK